MPKRRTTSRTSSARTIVTARRRSVVALAALFACSAFGHAPDPAPPPIATILATYDAATHSDDVTSLEQSGTELGDGLAGTFHSWRHGDAERDDDQLGPRTETTLRLGDRLWVRNESGDVRELHGSIWRRNKTEEFIDSGDFLKAPERSRFLGYGTIGASSAWRIEVNAEGGEPETLWIDVANGLPLRLEYLDGDGPTDVDFSDWREVEGRRFPFRSVSSDGDHAFDVVEQTTSIAINASIAPSVFAPLANNVLDANGVQTLPLLDLRGHVGCTVTLAGKPYTFLLDSGSSTVVVDSGIAKVAGIDQSGALEVRGAVRTGGLHLVSLPPLGIGTATLRSVVGSSLDLGASTRGMALFDGILGYPFFAASLVELDFGRALMRFGPPGSFVPRGERIPLDLDRELPEAVLRVDGRVSAPFIVDIGNSGELLIYKAFADAHPGIAPFTGKSTTNIGIGGTNATFRTQVDRLELGSVPMYRRTTDLVMATQGAFADRVDAGNLGLGTLKNFVVTFDFANNAMYLAKGEDFDDGARRPDTTGT